MNILSVDFGTSSVKMAVFDENSNILSSAKVSYDYEVIDKLKAQIDLEIVYEAFLKGLNMLGDYVAGVDVVAPCVFSPVLVPLDRDGNALHPAIIHLDRRSYAQSRYALKAVGRENFLGINGNLPFPGGISCTSILWFRDNAPDIYEKTYKFGHMNTFFHRRMVGRWLIDPSNASFTGLYETFKMSGWSDFILNSLGIDKEKLPEIAPSISVAGELTREAAAQTGLKEGIPVIMGANDTTSAAYGAGAVNNGDILNVSGSSEIITITTDSPRPDEHYYIRTSMEQGKWLLLAITVGGFALEWFRKTFYTEMESDEFYNVYLDNFVKEHKKTDVRFKPYLAGDRHSLVKKRGAFTGLTFDSSKEDLLLALLIGTYEPVFNTINICRKYMDLNPSIFWTGGLVSESYQQFKKSIFKGYDFNLKRECSLMGNAKAALKLMGLN